MSDLHLLALFLIGTMAAARVTRLLVHDKLPPIERARTWLIAHSRNGWDLLWRCHWCMSFWAVLLIAGLWFALAAVGWSVVWWIGCATTAAWYAAGMIVERDEAGDDQ